MFLLRLVTDHYRFSATSPPARLLPILPVWWQLRRWSCGSPGRNHSPTVRTILPLLRCGALGNLDIHKPSADMEDAIDVNTEPGDILQGLRSYISFHWKRTEDMT